MKKKANKTKVRNKSRIGALKVKRPKKVYFNEEDKMNFQLERKHLGKWLMATGIIFSSLIVLWLILMFNSLVSGSIEEQIIKISKQSVGYQCTFFINSLYSILLVAIMIILGLFVDTKKPKGIIDIWGIVLLAPYTLLVSIAYTSQYTIFPRLLADISDNKFEIIKFMYFGNPNSLAYFLDYLGYTFFALSALAIGFKFLYEKGIKRIIGLTLWLSGISCIIGFWGFSARIPFLEVFTVIGGVFILPFGILVSIYGAKLLSYKLEK